MRLHNKDDQRYREQRDDAFISSRSSRSLRIRLRNRAKGSGPKLATFTPFRTVLNSLPITGPLLAPLEFASAMRTDFWWESVLSLRLHVLILSQFSLSLAL